MAFLDFFRKQDNRSSRHLRNTGKVILHKGRVEALQNTWAGANRGFLNSPNGDIRRELEKTRELSRQLCATDPYAARFIELLAIYVIGEQGIQLEPKVITADGELDTDTNKTIKSAWARWSEEASLDGRFNWKELEELAVRSLGRDGEAIFRIVKGKSVNQFGFALHPVDPALLDHTYSVGLSGNKYIALGVEFDGVERVAYHIWNRYNDSPAGTANSVQRVRERIPANEIIHIYLDERGSLVRGLPWTTPALTTLARLSEYSEAHLLACQVASAAPLVMTNDGDQSPSYDDVSVGNSVNADGTTDATNQTVAPMIDLSFSQILELEPKKKLEALNLQFPQSQYNDTVTSYLKSVASALNVSYSSLASDGGEESYASGRLGSILERDHWKSIQHWLARKFHQRVYREWLETALLSNALTLASDDPADYYAAIWRPRGFRWVDPSKDAAAYKTLRDNGWMSSSQIVSEMGGEFRDVVDEIAAENQYAASKGVPLPAITDSLTLAEQVAALEASMQNPTPSPTPAKKSTKRRPKESK